MPAASRLTQLLALQSAIPGGPEPSGLADLARGAADELGLEFLAPGSWQVATDCLPLVPADLLQRGQHAPLGWRAGRLRVAVVDPIDAAPLDRLAAQAGAAVEPVLALASDLRRALEAATGGGTSTRSGAEDSAAAAVRRVMDEAVALGASDIHVEPQAGRLRVRCRLDGDLQETAVFAPELQPAIVSRLKILAGLSIAERRLPQDGRIRLEAAGRGIDLRVSTVPGVHGESVVLRVLDSRQAAIGLADLGLQADDAQHLGAMLRGAGLVLVTGPTGSGKTTTLYACLNALNTPDRKIVTLEDPIEYQLPGVCQVPVTASGLGFAAALRAVLRQSPSVVMVGEIRDRETAEVAVQAALTGHLVLSTLHTNDAPSAVDRLADLGIAPYLVSAALRAVVAQRLVRQLCPSCRQSRPATPREQAILGAVGAAGRGEVGQAAGCAACAGRGYRGRLGLFELFLVDDAARALIYDNVTVDRLRRQARAAGLRSTRDDGLCKVLAGHTTIEEVVSATVTGHTLPGF